MTNGLTKSPHTVAHIDIIMRVYVKCFAFFKIDFMSRAIEYQGNGDNDSSTT